MRTNFSIFYLLGFALILANCQNVSKKNILDKEDKQYKKQIYISKQTNDEDSDGRYLSNINCLGYCPVKKTNKYSAPNILVDHEIITLSMNITTKFADWVAYRVKRQNMSRETKPRNWAKEPNLSKEITLIPSDYKGLNTAPYFFDRGHQAPLAAFKNHPKWYVVNYLSNITPQKKYLNQGPWNALEARERKLATNDNNEVFVLTGPYYDKNNVIRVPEPKRISYVVPSGYWKIISIKDKKKVKTISFLFTQNTSKNDSYCNHFASIKKIIEKTSLEFPKIISSVLDQNLKNQIGCSE